VLVILAVLGGGGYYLYDRLLGLREQESAPIYATAPVLRGNITVVVEGYGQLQPIFLSYLESPTEGRVESLHIEQGQTVKAGDLVAKLSNDKIGYELQEAQFNLERMRLELASLLDVPVSEVTRVDPSVGAQIRAPIDGRIVDLKVATGTNLAEGSLVARIVDDSRIVIVAELLHGEIAGVTREQRVELRFPQFDNVIEGKVRDINENPIPKDTHFVYRVTIEAPNPGLLRPGLEVRLTMQPPTGPVPIGRTQYIDRYWQETFVYSPAQGTVATVHVKELGRVRAGDVLATLGGDTTRRYIQQKQLDIRELELSIAQKQEIRERLVVYSAITGTVAWVNTRVGQYVRPGEPFAHVFDNSRMNLHIRVDEIDVVHLEAGQDAVITVEAMPGRTFPAKVRRVDMMGHTEGGFAQYGVFLEVDGTEALKPGMTANVSIFIAEKEDVLLVPMEAVFERDGRACVEVLAAGVPKLVEVQIGLINDRVAEIQSGLNEGDLAITGSSLDRLDRPGDNSRAPEKSEPVPMPVPAKPVAPR
jgi:multidrug efflux pump subunit AcrA (membrane-fusion protein)